MVGLAVSLVRSARVASFVRHVVALAAGLGVGGADGRATTEVHARLPDGAEGAGDVFSDRPGAALGAAGARKSVSLPKPWDVDELDVAGVDEIVDDNVGNGIRESIRLISSTLRLGSWSTI